MAVKMVAGESISEEGTPLLEDAVRGFVDFDGGPAGRSKSGYWRSASFIIGVEVAAKFAFVGIGSNLISYLTGPLGLSTAAAAANVNAWSGTASLLPLVGGFVADSFWGRYRTIIIAASLYILGIGFLSLSAALHSFNSSNCIKTEAICSSSSPPPLEFIAFFVSLYLVAFAEGGIRPCLQAFGADQFDEEDKNESKAKSSFFNWWFFSMCSGSLLAFSALNYVQENLSWALGFGIPCIVICFALITFLLGSATYRFHVRRDERTPFARISRVFVNAGRYSAVCHQSPCDEQGIFEFRDKEVHASDSRRDADDAKAILGLLPIWCACLGYAIVSSQVSTLFTKQGSAMDRRITSGFQIPAASLQSLTSLTVLVLIPIYDRILVPIASVITKNPTGISMLQRVGAGLFMSFLSMVAAALVERQRLALAIIAIASEHGDIGDEANLMSVWWLVPQYLLFGIADVFVVVGLQEFFYSQAPGELKSIGVAMYLSIIGIGNFLSSFMIFAVEKASGGGGRESWFSNDLNRAHLDYFYWLLAGIGAATMAAYVCFAKSYVYRRKDMVS